MREDLTGKVAFLKDLVVVSVHLWEVLSAERIGSPLSLKQSVPDLFEEQQGSQCG